MPVTKTQRDHNNRHLDGKHRLYRSRTPESLPMRETLEDFRQRGGTVTLCEPVKSPDPMVRPMMARVGAVAGDGNGSSIQRRQS